MPDIRDIRASARAGLHSALSVSAFYFETKSAEPVPCTVRVHKKMIQQGDMKGTSFSYAETAETDPSLIFLRSEIPHPAEKAIVVLSSRTDLGLAPEAYQIEQVEDPDGITVKAKVTQLHAARAAELAARIE